MQGRGLGEPRTIDALLSSKDAEKFRGKVPIVDAAGMVSGLIPGAFVPARRNCGGFTAVRIFGCILQNPVLPR